MPVAHAFVIKQIEYQGLQHVPLSTVKSVMPVTPGSDLTPTLSNNVITDLNNTGFFDDIQLYHQKGTLIVKVHERPTIAAVHFSGNHLIKSSRLRQVLTQAGMTVGSVFKQTTLHQIKTALAEQYMLQSKYAVRIHSTVTHLARNRVSIDITISEGLAARIEHINIVGAHAFSQSTLIDQLTIATPGLFSFITGDDKYSQARMAQSLKQLQSYYMDRGYIHYETNSVQASIGPNKRHFYITINIHEGSRYQFSHFHLKGRLILPKDTLRALVPIRAGQVFSRKQVMQAVKAIENKLADQGYAFATVNPVPTINEKHKTVAMTFYVSPGNLYYIHQINFLGNNVTDDKTLRERLKISEGATYSKTALSQSTLAFKQLPYLQTVREQIAPVKGSDNQLNVNYHVKEKTANSVTFSVGYSQLDAFMGGVSLDMPNLAGTGNDINIGTQLSKPYQSVNATFTQPYFTRSGISQSITVFGTRVDNSERSLVNYSTNTFGGKLNYAVPMSTWNYFNFGGGYDYTRLLQPQNDTSETVQAFTNANGHRFNTFTLTAGFSRNDTNAPYFPTSGVNADVSGELSVPGSTLTWYKLLSSATWYYPLTKGYTFSVVGRVNYGNGYGSTQHLPFFDNFYGGGWDSVRGFASGSLGPKDKLNGTTDSGNSIGGNLSILGSASLYFPVPFISNQHNFRVGVFADMGNVYDTYDLSTTVGAQPESPNFGNLLYSAGLSFQWLSPLGLLGMSIAEPFNANGDSDTQIFNFSIGGTF